MTSELARKFMCTGKGKGHVIADHKISAEEFVECEAKDAIHANAMSFVQSLVENDVGCAVFQPYSATGYRLSRLQKHANQLDCSIRLFGTSALDSSICIVIFKEKEYKEVRSS